MLTVAFDTNPILKNPYSGFFTYGTGLLQGFEQCEEDLCIRLFYERRYQTIAASTVNTLPKLSVEHCPTRMKIRWLEKIWSKYNWLSLQRWTGDFDVYHSIHHLMPPAQVRPRILTVHDLRRYTMPELYPQSDCTQFERAVHNSDHFITVSNSTKNDLTYFLGIEPDRISVVYLAASSNLQLLDFDEKERLKQQLEQSIDCSLQNYIVTFSSPDSRKNILRELKAFVNTRDKLPRNTKFVVIGQLPKRDYEDVVALAGQEQNIVLTGPVAEAWQWLACADALVFASLYEGFGLPIIEAYKLRIPVITSNISSMPEVAGDAALLVDPYNIDMIGDAMRRIYGERKLYNELSAKGGEISNYLSWKRTAQETLGVYRSMY